MSHRELGLEAGYGRLDALVELNRVGRTGATMGKGSAAVVGKQRKSQRMAEFRGRMAITSSER